MGVLGDEGFVDEVELGLEGELEVLEDVVDFGLEDGKIIFDPVFLFLDFLFEIVYIFFFVLQQEYQVVRENLPPVRIQEL